MVSLAAQAEQAAVQAQEAAAEEARIKQLLSRATDRAKQAQAKVKDLVNALPPL